MKSRSLVIIALAAVASGAAHAQFKEMLIQPRIWNDIPTSNLTITNDYPWSVMLNETNLMQDTGFATRHLFVFSSDGVNPGVINNNTHFQVSVDLTLSTSNPSVRKESGFQIVQPWGYDGPFMVASDGEIAVFGEWLPFQGWGNVYTAGTPVTITFRYAYDASDMFNKVTYTQNGNVVGPLIPGNTEQGFIDNSGFRLYSQNRRTSAGEDVNLQYRNIRAFLLMNNMVTGRVAQRGMSNLAGTKAMVEIRTAGTLLALETKEVTLAADGSWDYASVLTAGTYDVAVKPRTGLRDVVKNVTVDPMGWGAATLHMTGDIDGNNTVTVFDYDVLSANFDKTAADSDWLIEVGGVAPVHADLDGDGAVTVFDYDLLSTYFDLSGQA